MSADEQDGATNRPFERHSGIHRRRFLTGSASLLAWGTGSLLMGRARTAEEERADPMKVPGSPARSYGDRSSGGTDRGWLRDRPVLRGRGARDARAAVQALFARGD